MKYSLMLTAALVFLTSSFAFAQEQADFIQSDESGLIDISAEKFSVNRPGTGSKEGETFTQDSVVAGYLNNGYMIANMAAGDGSTENAETINIKLSYSVEFKQTGTHYLWLRVHFQDGKNDSFFYGINGSVVGQIMGNPYGQWRWERTEVNLTIDSVGVYQIDIFGREPNSLLDHIYITPNPGFDPLQVGEPSELTQIFVSPNGSDSNEGTIDSPLASIQKAQSLATPGDTVYIRGGAYQPTEDDLASINGIFASVTYLNKSGVEGARINYWAYPGEQPVFDFSLVKPTEKRVVGIYVTGSFIHLKGLELTGIQTTIKTHTESYAIRSEGSHNIYELLSLHDNIGTGIRHFSGGHNLFLNIDAYRNWDNVSQAGLGSNNDGIGVHPSEGSEGNIIRGCRVWFNSDDGIDIIRAGASIEIDNSWAFYNGYSPDFKSLGDGTGFKAGGHAYDAENRLPEVIPSHTIKFSIAAGNKVNGFYANHHLAGNNWYNNTAYQNTINFNFLNRPSREDNSNIDTDGYDHLIINNLSHFRGIASRHVASLDTSLNEVVTNSWEITRNLSDDDFESLDISLLTAPRNDDGSLPDVQFMRPTENSRIVNAGTDIGFDFESSAPDLGAIETVYSTPVSNEIEPESVHTFKLEQNYPNPFNPSTSIGYNLTQNSFVSLKVYSISGKEVSVLVNGHQLPGSYQHIFHGDNLPSGVYFYRLQVNADFLVNKMVLLK